jgi:NitT/TauT family transport system permease protein
MKRKLSIALFYVGLLGLWQLLFELKFQPTYLLPSPAMVVERLIELLGEGRLIPSLVATLQSMIMGFAISVVIGICFGLAMGTNPIINQSIKSLFLGLQTLPTAAWVPLSLIIFGLDGKGIYFVVVMSSMAAIAISTADGILNIPPLYLRAARTLGTPPHAMPFRVILPAALPHVVSGIKLGWTMGWHGVVSAELIQSTIGLGYLLHMGRELMDMSQVIGIMVLTVVFGLLLDRFLFGVIEHRIRTRWGLASHTTDH